MRAYDFTPLYRSAIGFDRLARLLDDAQRSESEINYPPYNIELISEDQYRSITPQQVWEAAKRYLDPAKSYTFRVLPKPKDVAD